MPLAPISTPPYPDVPLAPGVPPVQRDTAAAAVPEPTPLRRDDSSVSQSTGRPKWGLFDDAGAPLLMPDSFVSVSYAKDWRIADYPLEQGGFESYNKVTRPYEIRVTVSKGGTESDRADFIAALDALGNSLTLVSTVTPERTYLKGNIEHVDYDRSSHSGAALIIATLGLKEIRTLATATFLSSIAPADMLVINTLGVSALQYGTPQTPSAADPVNAGTVQPQPLTPAQTANLEGAN